MIQNNDEMKATKERIRYFQIQVERLRIVENNPHNYRAPAGGYLAEIDRMSLEVREYLSVHPSDMKDQAA